MNNNQSILGNRLYNHYPDGFGSYFIIGRRNIGKSTYALIAAYCAFIKLGYKHNEAWEKALHSICFSIPEVIDFLEYAIDQNVKEFVLIWDDVRVHASGHQYFINIELVKQLSGLLDTIKVVLNNIILTCPSSKGLLGVFTTFDDYSIQIQQSKQGGNYRLAKGYQWNTTPAGQKRIYKKFREDYYCRLPNWVYALYIKRRIQITKDTIYAIKELTKK